MFNKDPKHWGEIWQQVCHVKSIVTVYPQSRLFPPHLNLNVLFFLQATGIQFYKTCIRDPPVPLEASHTLLFFDQPT